MLLSRPLVLAMVAALSAGSGATAQAGCCGLFGNSWGSYYAPYYGSGSYYAGYGGYSDGFYGSNYSGYGPSYYGGCDSCGCGSYGCSSCAGGACSSCADGSCAGGNCGVVAPYSPTPKPDSQASPPQKPEDRFQPGSRPGAEDGALPPKTWEETPKSRSGGDRTDSGFPPARGRQPAAPTSPLGNDALLDAQPPDDSADQKLSPKGARKPELSDNKQNDDVQQQDVNRPNLGNGSEVIPKREAAPTPEPDLPDPPGVEKKSSDSPADSLKLDGKSTSKGAAPKTRLALQQNVDSLKIARVRARPSNTWHAAPQPPVLAKH